MIYYTEALFEGQYPGNSLFLFLQSACSSQKGLFYLVFNMNRVIMYACNPVLASWVDATVMGNVWVSPQNSLTIQTYVIAVVKADLSNVRYAAPNGFTTLGREAMPSFATALAALI